jgi:cell division septum initiation protein DivIVA
VSIIAFQQITWTDFYVPYPIISKHNTQVKKIEILQKEINDKDMKIATLEQKIENMQSSSQDKTPTPIHTSKRILTRIPTIMKCARSVIV